jgi:thiol-disulfide isomerase/thioredoxin
LPAGTYRIRCRDTLQNFEGVQELNITDGQQEYDVARSEMASTKFMALVGDLAPGLNVKWRPGDEVWLHELKGKVVVIDFWADWCIPCVQQMPALIDIAVQYKDKPIEWIAIHSATQDSVEGMEQTIDTLSKQRWNKPLPFHVALDARRPGTRSTGETDSAYHVAEWPTLVVIKPDGTVYGRVTKDSLSAVIDKLLTSTKQ